MICNAIDNTRFFPVDTFQKSAIRKQIDLNDNENILLVARRLVKKNGVNYAAEAMKILKDRGLVEKYCLKLLIVGRGPEQNEIENYISLHDLSFCIKVVGIIEHKLIDSYYKSADIILMPSTLSDDIEEATSLSMLEGLACGKIVIASAIGGLKEVIKNSSNGILVDDKSPDQIAESVKKVLTDLVFREKIEKIAYEYATLNCGYLTHSQKFIHFYLHNFSKINSNN
jgi:glycosyltransferase involved in cell wall biosynthesis